MGTVKQLPKGIRNNNPGNIRNNPNNKWQGQIGKDGVAADAMCIFQTAEQGLRALARIVGNDLFNNKTLRQTITEWAPGVENNTAAYVNSVAAATGLPTDLIFNKTYVQHILPDFVQAIVRHENGNPADFGRGDVWFPKGKAIIACREAFPQYTFV